MSESVSGDIAERVEAKAEADPVARQRAIVAARDARCYLHGVRHEAIEGAYLRYTASNTPAAQVARARTKPTWRYPAWAVVCGGIVALVVGAASGDAAAGIVTWAAFAALLGCLTWKQNQLRRKRYEQLEAQLAASNPWPWGAERVPAHNPDAERGSTRVETRLLGLAVLISEEIRRSPAWNNPILDQHGVRIDLDATLGDISGRAYRVWRIRTDAAWPLGQSEFATVLHQQFAEYAQAARMAEAALRDHVAALAEYLGELRPLERMLRDLALLRRAAEHCDDRLLRQLYADATGGWTDAARVRDHATDLRDLSVSLDAQFQYLREQVRRSQLLM